MTGHESLIALRRRGKTPSGAWLHLLDAGFVPTAWDRPEQTLRNSLLPEIHIDADEVPERLDFRCIAGMTVHIVGGATARTLDVIDRLTEFDPLRIVACRTSPNAILEWTPETGLVELEIA